MMPNQKNIMLRFSFIILVMVLIGIAIICKAGVIMFAERQYWKDVADRFVKENVTVRPTRGNIISSDGQLMASSLPEYKIYMDFMINKRKSETEEEEKTRLKLQHIKDSVLYANLDTICKGLHEIFPDKSAAFFKQHIKNGRKKESRSWLLYPKRISYIQYKEAKRLPVFNLNKYKGGFHEQAFNQRKKPFGSLAMRTLGDMFPDIEQGAKNGLELSYDSILKGRNGITHRQKVMNKYLNIVDIPPVDGCDIITTIDVGMQDIAEKALVDELKEINATVGVAILMEVQTGDIKAIVNMTKCNDGIYREIRNNAISDMMEPGSTFKTASILVALDDGVITPETVVETGNGVYMMHGRYMKDHNWHRGGYGTINTTKSLMVSSNIGVSRLIDDHYHDNPEKFVRGLHRVGIATPLDLDIPGAGKPNIRIPNKDLSNWSRTALAWMSIGYETQIPPINTLAFYNAIANNGVMVKPRFVKSIVKDGQVVEDIAPEILNPAIASPKAISEIQTILEKVVSEGLGKKAGSKQFHVSGKTGTAQVSQGKAGYTNGTRRYLVSFCGYFPSEAPKYSCIVAIQKPGLPASGGLMAGSVFSKIAERVFAKHLAQDLKEAKDSTSILIPDVKNGDISAAHYVLNYMKDHNWHRGGYGTINTTKSLMVSSNIGVSRLIDDHYHDNPEKFVRGLHRVGIATPLDLDIPGAGKPNIRIPNKDLSNWSRTALAWMSIGYETQIPPINTLAFYNAIANNGVMVKPRFVKSIVKDGQVVEDIAPEILNPAIASPKAISEIQTILEKVVSEGLGKKAGSKQFHVSGKTGTAQVSQGKAGYTNGTRRYLVSFCGYFPSEAPKYSCIVAIQKPGLPASGGLMAGSVFSKIAERVFAKHLAQDLKEAKDSTSILIPDVKNGDISAAHYVLNRINVNSSGVSEQSTEGKPVWGNVTSNPDNVLFNKKDINNKLVPSVIGMGAKDAVYLLESMGLKARITGIGKVKSQSIPAGNTLRKGQTIQLRLN